MSTPVQFSVSLKINDTPQGGVWYNYNMNGELNQIAITNAYNESLSVVYTNFAGYGYGYSVEIGGSVFTQTLTRDTFKRENILSVSNTFNSSVIKDYAYTYDALGRPTERNTDSFDYNLRNEVVSASVHSNLTNYAYDEIGNFTETSDTTFTVNANNQYTAIDSAQLQYDADGNLTHDGEFAYSYDAENRLIQIEPVSATNGQIRIQNQYDYKHRRIRKTIQQLNEASWDTIQTHDFTYDSWNLIHERITQGTQISNIQYFWGLDLSGTLQGVGGVGGLLAVSINGNYYLPCYDANGNITAYVNENGQIVAIYTYDAFGNTLAQSGSMVNSFTHRFSTKYLDTLTTDNCSLVTDLYYYGYRFYSPSMSRWFNRDPIEEQGGLNLYAFCGNNGVSRFDVLGMACTVVSDLTVDSSAEWELDALKLESWAEDPPGYKLIDGFTTQWKRRGEVTCCCSFGFLNWKKKKSIHMISTTTENLGIILAGEVLFENKVLTVPSPVSIPSGIAEILGLYVQELLSAYSPIYLSRFDMSILQARIKATKPLKTFVGKWSHVPCD